jgi:Nickel responsive protein SCO4226-like
MPHIIVEYVFDPPATEEEHDRIGQQLGPCLEGRDVRYVQTFISLDRRRRVCVFEAPDAETLRTSYRSANVAFERMWAAERITADE